MFRLLLIVNALLLSINLSAGSRCECTCGGAAAMAGLGGGGFSGGGLSDSFGGGGDDGDEVGGDFRKGGNLLSGVNMLDWYTIVTKTCNEECRPKVGDKKVRCIDECSLREQTKLDKQYTKETTEYWRKRRAAEAAKKP